MHFNLKSVEKNQIPLVVASISLLFYNLFFNYKFNMPYGFDEVITTYPIGRTLDESKLNLWARILFSRFLSEDHLFPVTNLVSYFIYKLNGNFVNNLFIVNRFIYILIIYISIKIMKILEINKNTIFIFLILFLNSGSLNLGLLSYNINFNLVCIFSLLTIYFFLVAQKNEINKKSLKLNFFLNNEYWVNRIRVLG